MAQTAYADTLRHAPRTAAPVSELALVREFIVDAHRAVIGYGWAPQSPPAANDDPRLFTQLRSAGAQTPVGSRTIFIPCTFEQMADGCLRLLDPRKTVLEVSPLLRHTPEGIRIRGALLAYAKSSGFRLAFDHTVLRPEYAAWLPMASYVQLDMQTLGEAEAVQLARHVSLHTKAQALARNVSTDAQYEDMKGAGAALFEGLWFAKPPESPQARVLTSQASVLQLLALVSRDAEIGDIENVLKRDPALSFRLLSFINSPGFGMTIEITSFRHAVMVMGMKRLLRWAALLLTAKRPGGPAPAAGTIAVVRGRMMELLAADKLSPAQCDTAFVVGVFSMLDTLLGIPLAAAMDMVNLPADAVDAVLHGRGPYAPYLMLARSCEAGAGLAACASPDALGYTREQLNAIHLQGLMWADHFENGMA